MKSFIDYIDLTQMSYSDLLKIIYACQQELFLNRATTTKCIIVSEKSTFVPIEIDV